MVSAGICRVKKASSARLVIPVGLVKQQVECRPKALPSEASRNAC